MTQAFEAFGEASRGMTSDAGQLEHGARGVPPFALHGTLCLAALLVLAACGPSQPSSPTRNVSTGAETVPDFAGAAEPIASRMDDEAAQKVCPPAHWPPAYVLGLSDRRHYPVAWHTTNPH